MIDAAEKANAEMAAFRFRDLFSSGPTQNFRRASLSILSQLFQQFTGINLVSYYASYLFINTLGLSQTMGRIMGSVLSTEYALAAAVTVTFVDRLGRRPTMFWGAIGCGLSFVVATVLVYFVDRDNNRKAAWGAVAMYFVYNTCKLNTSLLLRCEVGKQTPSGAADTIYYNFPNSTAFAFGWLG